MVIHEDLNECGWIGLITKVTYQPNNIVSHGCQLGSTNLHRQVIMIAFHTPCLYGSYRLGHAMLGDDNIPLLLLCFLLFIELLVIYIKMKKKREKVEVRMWDHSFIKARFLKYWQYLKCHKAHSMLGMHWPCGWSQNRKHFKPTDLRTRLLMLFNYWEMLLWEISEIGRGFISLANVSSFSPAWKSNPGYKCKECLNVLKILRLIFT